MSNHIHIFLYLEHQRELTEEELFSRINKLYKGQRLKEALQEWEMRKKEEARICAEHGGGASASSFRELQNDYKRRMFDLSEFMKILKQNMTMSFNARRDHTGTIWEGRFYDKMSDVKVKSMSMQAAYIDCNPVEAGICRNPAEYEWCSWAAAKAGNDHARSMYRFIYNNPDASWEDIEKLHEKAISARVGEIDTAIEAGGIVDWLFSMFDSEKGKKSEQEQDDESKCKEDMPRKWDLQLEEGNSETAMTILRLLEGGDKSCAEIAQAIGISSKPWLSKAYLAPLVAQGYVGLTVPERVNSRHQKYHLLQKGQTLL